MLPANLQHFVTSPQQPITRCVVLLFRRHPSREEKTFLGFILSRVSFFGNLEPPCAPIQENHSNRTFFPHILLFMVRFSLPKTQIVLNLRGHTSSGLSDFVRINP